MDKLWLPKGHHWDLHIEHDRSGDAGPFTGGGWKLLWHITVSPWVSIDSMVRVLKDKGAEPHLVIGGRPGTQHPVVVQLVPFNRAGRSLANNQADGYATNKANVIQVEICARPGRSFAAPLGLGADEDRGSTLFDFENNDARILAADLGPRARGFVWDESSPEERSAALDLCVTTDTGAMLQRAFSSGVGSFGLDTYRALGNLASLVDNRVPIPAKLARSFQNTTRFTDRAFVASSGHLGHMHAPDNDHIDPTKDFSGSRLLKYLKSAPNQL